MCFLLVGTLAAGPGCLYRQSVKYSLKDVSPVAASPFADRTLGVKEFQDTRPPQENRSIWKKMFGSPAPRDSRAGRSWFYNGNENYKDKRAAPWVTQMLAKHLAAAKLFKEAKVSGEEAPGSDLLLEGTIEEFYGGVESSGDAEALEMSGMQFGAVGGLLAALAMTRIKTEYHGKVVLIDLKLSDVRTGKVVWEGNVEGEVRGKHMADTDGLRAYDHANEALKAATKSLVENLQKSAASKPQTGSTP